MKTSFWALMPLALLLTVGCGKEAADTGTQTSKPEASEPVLPAGDTAEAAVKKIVNGLSTGKTSAVWAALPPGYQKDVNDLVRTFGNGMDPAVWQQIQGVVATVQAVLSTKADFIVNVPSIQGMEQGEKLKETIPKVAGLLKIVVDHTDLDSLKSFDGQAFFSGPAARLLAQADALSELSPGAFSLSDLKNAKIETISSDGDKATLKITIAQDATQAQEIEFVKIDDHWIPAELASDWVNNIAAAKESLAELPEMVKESAMMINMATAGLTGLLQSLEAAEDQAQFDTAVEQLQGGIMGLMMGGFAGGGPPSGVTEFESPDGTFSTGEPGGDAFPESTSEEADEPEPASAE